MTGKVISVAATVSAAVPQSSIRVGTPMIVMPNDSATVPVTRAVWPTAGAA